MKSTLKKLGSRVIPAAITALALCGCPEEGGRVKFGFWSLTELSLTDKPLFKNGIKLNLDGTITLYIAGDEPEENTQWEQSGDTFSLITKDRTYISTIVSSESVEGLIFNNGNLTTPVGKFIMRFISKDLAGLPKVRTGHWKITFMDGGAVYGMFLKEDGTVEDSPLGKSVLSENPRVTTKWVEQRGFFKISYFFDGTFFAADYFAIVDRANFLEGRSTGDLQLTFTAQHDPTIIQPPPPVETP